MKQENLEQLIEAATIPSYDNGQVFTDTTRLDFIRRTLQASNYSCIAECPLALMYKRNDFVETKPFIILSCHADSIYEQYFFRRDATELHGTFDNSACNAVALNAMLESQLGPQVIVCFTGDEERRSRGAGQVINTLTERGLFELLEMAIVMDLTEEEFGKPCTAENLAVKDSGNNKSLLRFSGKNELGRYICGILPNTPLIKNGDPDEAWKYDEYNINCFSLCLPCRLLGRDMHDSRGVALARDSVLKYATALAELAAAIEKDMADKVTNHNGFE